MPNSLKDSQTLEWERDRRRAIRTSLADWARLAGFTPAAHHLLLLSELEALSRGEIDRLMVLMPPGSAKSTYASVLFPAWWFTQHATSSVIAASHTSELAEHFARSVRNLVVEHGPRLGYGLAQDSRAAARFQVVHAGYKTRGEYFATGVRGPITGRRADLAIIDDPVKSQAEADSPGLREHVWNWFRSDLTTRLKPRGRIVLIMTRWHADDLGGRLLAQQPAEWRVIRLPALAEPDDPLGRPIGAPLWPEWEDAAALARKRAAVGERVWSALFQQTPRLLEGSLFRVSRIAVLEMAPAFPPGRAVRAWDLAATAGGTGDPDWTVGVKLLREISGRFVVLDVVRLRGGPHDVEAAMANTASQDGVSVSIGLPQDPGQAGRAQVAWLVRALAGYHVIASPESGAKETRALPVAAQADAGNLVLVRGPWNLPFLEELRDFPHGAKDDQVDALSRAFGMLIEEPGRSRRINVPLMPR